MRSRRGSACVRPKEGSDPVDERLRAFKEGEVSGILNDDQFGVGDLHGKQLREYLRDGVVLRVDDQRRAGNVR